ncbi:MAG: hypothetical protein ACE37F_09925 [Nannocystaceae bacterium]|nr:hypothetical protein [bacterium]
MHSKSPRVRAPEVRGTVAVRPDLLVVSVRVRVDQAEPSHAPTELGDALRRIGELVAPAEVTPVSYTSSSEKTASKSLFGSGRRTTAEAVCRVELGLAPSDGFIDRAIALESLRDSLETANLEAVSVVVGDSRYAIATPQAHRAAAIEALHDDLSEAARACGMTLERLELSTTLDVAVAGPCEASVSVSGTARLAAISPPTPA